MDTYSLHWKWFNPLPKTPEWTEWKLKKIGTIDNVINLKNLVKFGFGKSFGDWGIHRTHTQCIWGFGLFKNFFLRSLMKLPAQTAGSILTRKRQSIPLREI